MPYRLERNEILRSSFIALWALLGFQAGYINAFGFAACARYVSHVTGFGTQIGIALAGQQIWFAVELLGFPFAFVLGSFFCALVTAVRIENRKLPRYDLIATLLPLFLVALLGLAETGVFGTFGEPFVFFHDFALMYGLSFFCGMQNGCFATMTKGLVRTTHLTGLSTDLGTDFARLIAAKLDPKEFAATKRTNLMRLATFVAFAFGSIVSVVATLDFQYRALLIPIVTASLVLVVILRLGRRRFAPGKL